MKESGELRYRTVITCTWQLVFGTALQPLKPIIIWDYLATTPIRARHGASSFMRMMSGLRPALACAPLRPPLASTIQTIRQGQGSSNAVYISLANNSFTRSLVEYWLSLFLSIIKFGTYSYIDNEERAWQAWTRQLGQLAITRSSGKDAALFQYNNLVVK